MIRLRTHVSVALMLCGLLGLGACREEPQRPTQSDELLLSALGEARALQRRADLHLLDGDLAAAVIDVQEVLSIRFPTSAPEAEEIRLDAYARLARLLLSQAALQPPEAAAATEERALAQLDAARKVATRDSFFRAHLESVAADVYEARARRLPDPEAQKQVRRQALDALERAIRIDREVQRALLNLPPGSTTAAPISASTPAPTPGTNPGPKDSTR